MWPRCRGPTRSIRSNLEIDTEETTFKIITLNASKWKTLSDFYEAIFEALGSPEWHGDNVNALTESMVWGEINAVEPPYTVRIVSMKDPPPDVQQELTWTAEGVAKARKDFKSRKGHDVDVNFELVP